MSKAAPTFESFKYIHTPDRACAREDVLENKYNSVDALHDRFIVYAHGIGYRVYGSREDFLEHLDMMKPADRVYHEVIFDREQKLKFDIDAPLDKLKQFNIPIEEEITLPNTIVDDLDLAALIDDISMEPAPAETRDSNFVKYQNIRDTIIRTIIDTFFITYGIVIDEKVIICESSDPTAEIVKYSNHVIINGYKVSNHVQAKEFTRRVNSYLYNEYRTFLDVGVNKRIQNFRLVGCHKTDDNRVKRVITDHDMEKTIITNVDGCEHLRDIVSVENATSARSDMHPDDVNKVLAICKQNGLLTAHRYKFNRNGVFIFSRIRGDRCDFCKRDHTADNTLVVTISFTDGVITVFKQCRRYIDEHGKDGNHTAAIGEFPSSSSGIEINSENEFRALETRIGGWTDRTITRCIKRDTLDQELLFDTLVPRHKNVYSEPSLQAFELTHTLVVHAMMKMGKTKTLRAYIDKYFGDGLRKKIIRFISFRQTFSGNIKEKFPNFTLYSDVKGMLGHDKLIVQVESLHRLLIQPGDEKPDLLILDECESIFEQFHAGLTNNYECFSKFQYLMAHSKHVVCMDANISDRTFRILRQMRPGFAAPDSGVVYHCNRFKNATDDRYYITGDKLKWLGVLYTSIEADERIAVPMSSLTEAKILVKNLGKKYPQKQVKLYSSETAMSEKREHFSDVNAYWSQYDVLVYTPTVSAGVSFELKHFNKVFGYFTDQSCPVETCVQMIGRIRDVSDRKLYMCLCATGNNLPTDIDAIRDWVITKRENLFKDYDESGLTFEYRADGERALHPTCGDYFTMWLENTRVKNISKNSFIQRFVEVVSFTGAQIAQLTEEVFTECTGLTTVVDGELNSDLEAIRDAHTVAKAEVREELTRKISASRDLAESELEDIQNAIVAQQDISEEQRYAYEKYRLRTDYKYAGPIDEKFVDKYRDPKVRRTFKNISRIFGYETIDEALKQIQAEERANYKFMMEMGEKSQHQELNRKYVFDQHRYALGLLKLCGWKNINDHTYIHKILLAKNLRDGDKVYWENIRHACVEFGMKSPNVQAVVMNKANDEKLVELMLGPVNRILGIMYGIQIVDRRKDPGMYFVTGSGLFTADPAIAKSKNIPLIQCPKKTILLD